MTNLPGISTFLLTFIIDSLNNEFARNLGVKKRQMNEINHESLPNPWISRKSGDPAKSKNGIFALKDDMVDSLLDFYDPSLMPGKRNTAETPSSFLAPSSFMGMRVLLPPCSERALFLVVC